MSFYNRASGEPVVDIIELAYTPGTLGDDDGDTENVVSVEVFFVFPCMNVWNDASFAQIKESRLRSRW